jgi:hypothetical protein
MSKINRKYEGAIEGLQLTEFALFEARKAAKSDGLDKMGDCLGQMLAAIRSMLTDLGVK